MIMLIFKVRKLDCSQTRQFLEKVGYNSITGMLYILYTGVYSNYNVTISCNHLSKTASINIF